MPHIYWVYLVKLMSISDNKRGRKNLMWVYHVWKKTGEGKNHFYKTLDKCQFLCTGFFQNIQSHLIIGRKHKEAFTSMLYTHSPGVHGHLWPLAAARSNSRETRFIQLCFYHPNPPLHLSVINILQCCGLQRVLKIIEVTCFWVDRELKDFFSK